jgi:hypothetical protein
MDGPVAGGLGGLCATFRTCPVVTGCGGGLYVRTPTTQALTGSEVRLGRDHHHILAVATNLASDLAQLGELAEAHRYQSGSSFANSSVYCPDLVTLITEIRQAMRTVASATRGRPDLDGAALAAGDSRMPGYDVQLMAGDVEPR